MKYCDTCGGELGEADPFAVCPRCLLETALKAPAGAAQPPDHSPGFPGPEATPGLFVRREFFRKYEILERVGQGGQGDVWKVWDFELRRCLAMKRLGEQALAAAPALNRFLAEAQIASQLEHPGVLPIFDVGLDADGRPFYTTQLLEGTTLGDVWHRLRTGRDPAWTLPRALEMLLRVCETMAHAHSRGVIHRDLKPANVLVGPFGDVRVIDWGSAHVRREARQNSQEPFVPLDRPSIQTDRADAMWAHPASPLATACAGQPLTVLFTPPEILSGGTAEPGPWTDVYSVGVMLYELLAGRLPYSRPDGSFPQRTELQEAILRGPPPPVRSLNRAVSRDLAAVCQKAMAHAQCDRYQTMPELAEDIRAVLEIRPVMARKPNLLSVLQKWTRRNLPLVLLSATALVTVAVAFAVVRGLRAQRNAARQVTALRSAELAARNGQWHNALAQLAEAEAAGYADAIDLGLQRAEAWTVLAEPDRSRTELLKLARRSDLGARRATVVLRLGEHELFDQATASDGVRHVQEALTLGLAGADEPFARGLLAETTPQALALLHQALQINSFHHGAHRHSLGLEFVLGHHDELQDHFRFFNAVYPADPSAALLQAAELALHGRLAEAQAKMLALSNAVNSAEWTGLTNSLPRLAATAARCDLDALLVSARPQMPSLDLFEPTGGTTASPSALAAPSSDMTHMARLPSLETGLLEGRAALIGLMLPFVADIEPSIARIKASWRHHPEAMMPAFAAIYLDKRQPANGPKSIPLLQIQADLLQLAADSPSVLPGLSRTCRYLAARTQFELSHTSQTNAAQAPSACLANLRSAGASTEASAAEMKACFPLAFGLGDYDLARELLSRWERLQPGDPAAARARIQLEVAAGDLSRACALIDQALAQHPGDAWLLGQREMALKAAAKVLDLQPKASHPRP